MKYSADGLQSTNQDFYDGYHVIIGDEATFLMDGHPFVEMINLENIFSHFQQKVAHGISGLHFQIMHNFCSRLSIQVEQTVNKF